MSDGLHSPRCWTVPDVSDALYKLLVEDIMPTLNPRVLTPSPNAFRAKLCYRQEVDTVLKGYEPSLRAVFTAMCVTGGRGEKERHLALGEWVLLGRGTELIGVDCSERDASMCFAWSRMCVVDELTERGRMRDSHLPFEGFLEALIRMSILKVRAVAPFERSPRGSRSSRRALRAIRK